MREEFKTALSLAERKENDHRVWNLLEIAVAPS